MKQLHSQEVAVGSLGSERKGPGEPAERCWFSQELPLHSCSSARPSSRTQDPAACSWCQPEKKHLPCISSLTHPRRVGDRPTVIVTGQMGKQAGEPRVESGLRFPVFCPSPRISPAPSPRTLAHDVCHERLYVNSSEGKSRTPRPQPWHSPSRSWMPALGANSAPAPHPGHSQHQTAEPLAGPQAGRGLWLRPGTRHQCLWANL